MVVMMDKAKIVEQQLGLTENGSAELQQQIYALNDTIKTMKDQMEACKALAETKQKLSDEKDKLHKIEIESCKPTFWDNLGKIGIGIGIGIVLTIGVVLAL